MLAAWVGCTILSTGRKTLYYYCYCWRVENFTMPRKNVAPKTQLKQLLSNFSLAKKEKKDNQGGRGGF